MYQHLIYALQNDEIVSIEDVDRGLKCGCVCAACGDRLLARKGIKREHHFAHQSKEHCEYGYESSLHLMAKEVLSKAGTITVPEVSMLSWGSLTIIKPKRELLIKHVDLEHRVSDVIPDVVAYTDDGSLFVEIYVTHKVDDVKLEKLKAIRIPTLEIDLHWAKDMLIDEAWLSKYLIKGNPHKRWAYHPAFDDFIMGSTKTWPAETEVTDKSQVPVVSKRAGVFEVEIAKDILSSADHITVPAANKGCPREIAVRDVKLDEVLFDVVLHTDESSIGILFQTDGTRPDGLKSADIPVLILDIRNAASFTTKRQFAQSLLNNVANKSWL